MNPETPMQMPTDVKPVYLAKSVMLFKIYGAVFLFSVITTSLSRSLPEHYRDILGLLIGLPILGIFFMAPLGIFYSWRSYQRREGRSQTRFYYFLGHLFFCLLVLSLIVVLVNDISKLF